jgi:hypothetical protein
MDQERLAKIEGLLKIGIDELSNLEKQRQFLIDQISFLKRERESLLYSAAITTLFESCDSRLGFLSCFRQRSR